MAVAADAFARLGEAHPVVTAAPAPAADQAVEEDAGGLLERLCEQE
jgi:hypothetical protein